MYGTGGVANWDCGNGEGDSADLWEHKQNRNSAPASVEHPRATNWHSSQHKGDTHFAWEAAAGCGGEGMLTLTLLPLTLTS